MIKINKLNYHFHSIGSFRACPESWAKIAYEAQNKFDPIKLGNRQWLPMAKSGSKFSQIDGYVKFVYRPDSRYDWMFTSASSVYWVSMDRNFLLRLSDHWSSTEGPICGARICGSIRDCYWRIKTRSKKPIRGYQGFVLGICAFSDMRNRPVPKAQGKENMEMELNQA